MNRLLMFAVALSTSHAYASPKLALNPTYGKSVGECKARDAKLYVWIFKQWHLGPLVDTRNKPPAAALPQAKNQTSIYGQLNEWIENKKLKEVYAEGCAGELSERSTATFNGWDYRSLKKAASETTYPDLVSSVPLKIEAKYGDAVRTPCGDDEALIKENALAFSDARGALGFLTRLEQHQNDPTRAKNYLDGVIEVYKMAPGTTVPEAMKRLKKELKAAISRAQSSVDKRSAKLVEALKASEEKEVAAVFGGIHAAEVTRLLNQAGVGCTVVEPVGYQDDEAQLMSRLKDALMKL